MQLGEYVKWCRYTLQCVRAKRPKFWHTTSFDTDINDDDDNKDVDLDTMFMVNEAIVDNEFNGRDVSVELTWPNVQFQVSDPEVCTVRRSVAILCSLGRSCTMGQTEYYPPLVPRI